jgi:formiminoglutamase
MFFVTLAHSGERIPDLLKDRVNPEANLREISEPSIDEIFHWKDVERITTEIHQCFPNLNRRRTNVDPKTGHPYVGATALFPIRDFHSSPIYKPNAEMTEQEKNLLLQEYYDPFHKKIYDAIASRNYAFFLDAHAMNNAKTGYPSDRHHPAMRPDICLGNRGNAHGEPVEKTNAVTFPPPVLRKIAKAIEKKGYSCELNNPFPGGAIIQIFGKLLPCIQVEINKKLYMTADDGDVLPENILTLKRDLQDIFRNTVMEK